MIGAGEADDIAASCSAKYILTPGWRRGTVVAFPPERPPGSNWMNMASGLSKRVMYEYSEAHCRTLSGSI